MRFISIVMRFVSALLYFFILFAPSREIPEYSKGQLILRHAIVAFFVVASFCRFKRIEYSKRATAISMAIVFIPFGVILARFVHSGMNGADIFAWLSLSLFLLILLLLPGAFFLEYRASLCHAEKASPRGAERKGSEYQL